MIQDIAPLRLRNEFHYKKPDAGSRILAYGNRTVFLDEKAMRTE